jgi:signal peptidase
MAWSRMFLTVVARVVLCVIGGLVLCSIAPKVLGWHSDVVLTGSMEPYLRPGDLVVYQPTPASRVLPGQIILVHDPAHPGHLLSHRYMRRDTAGQMVTRGDANGHDDSTPVSEGALIGVARLNIPRVGLPLVWWRQDHRGRTAATALCLFGVTLLAAGTGTRKPRRVGAHRAGAHRAQPGQGTAQPQHTGGRQV